MRGGAMIDTGDLERLLDDVAERVAAKLTAAGKPTAQEGQREPWRTIGLAEVAEMLGRSERWVRERAKDPLAPLPRLALDGGSMRFDPDDVRAWARRRRVPAIGDSEL